VPVRKPFPVSQPKRREADSETLGNRLRREFAAAGLYFADKGGGPSSSATIEDLLARRAGGLADARKMRDAIIIVTALLGKLDELGAEARDASEYDEIISLFQDIADFAAFGADATRRAGARIR
jgi:hypothetical protein